MQNETKPAYGSGPQLQSPAANFFSSNLKHILNLTRNSKYFSKLDHLALPPCMAGQMNYTPPCMAVECTYTRGKEIRPPIMAG
jgi:hypothetical protein